MSDFYDLPTTITPGSTGHRRSSEEAHRRLGVVVVMPDPQSDSSRNVANFDEAVTRATTAGAGGTIVFPPGKWSFNSTLRVRNILGLNITGAGEATHLEFNMQAAADWITIEHSQRVVWSHMNLTGAGSGIARAAFALLRTNSSGSVYAPSQCRLADLMVDCLNKATSAVTIAGADANNDFHVFRDSVFQNYTERGFDLRSNLQSYGNQMYGVRLYAGTGAQYGVDMSTNVGGSFAWHGGFMSGHQAADFNLGRSYQPIVIDSSFHSENSARLLVAGGSYKQIALRNIRWAGNALHADNRAVVWSDDGQLLIEACSIGDGSSPTAALTVDIPASILQQTSIRLSRFYSSAAEVFTHGAPGDLYGSVRIPSEELVTPTPLVA